MSRSRDEPPPSDLRAGCLVLPNGEELVVLSFPSAPMLLPANLTSAEKAVVRLALTGLDDACIATARGTTRGTIAKQLASSYRKLGVAGRRELLAWAASEGR